MGIVRSTNIQTTLRIPQHLLEQLREEADRTGVSLNSYILILIDRARQGPQK